METSTYFQKISVQEKNAFGEAEYWDKLSFRERERYHSLHPLRRNDYAAGRIALKELLAGSYGGQPTRYEILSRSNGSPYVAAMPEMHCSISHSKGHIAIMISNHSTCGIDVEEKTGRSAAFAGYIASEKESELLSAVFPAELIPTIAWCAKEAAFKSEQEAKNITEYSVISATDNEIILRRHNLQFRIFIKISDNYIYAYGYQC